jgi:hypothetical protein
MRDARVYERDWGRMLRSAGYLPTWIIASGALPRDIPTGPRAKELTRLRVGVTGSSGAILARALGPIRRRQKPPAVIAEPPQGGGSGFEEWMY